MPPAFSTRTTAPHPPRLDLLDDEVGLGGGSGRASAPGGAPVAGEHVVAVAIVGAHVRQRMPPGRLRRAATRGGGASAAGAGNGRMSRRSAGDRVDLALVDRECQIERQSHEGGTR